MTRRPGPDSPEIEATRGDLSDNVNALADSVSPGNVARRQVDKVMDGAVRPQGPGHGRRGRRHLQSVGHAAGNVKDAAGAAPTAVRRGTRGNPVAAGLSPSASAGWSPRSSRPRRPSSRRPPR